MTLTKPCLSLLAALLAAAAAPLCAVFAQDVQPEGAPVNKEQIEAALKLTKEAAAKYEFTIGQTQPADVKLHADPILLWSNPAVGEIHGNVFLWTVDGRPAVVGSLYKWFTPHTHLSHEFHSLAETPLSARYEDKEVWAVEIMPWRDISSQREVYTTFQFKTAPSP
jgi:hypothetical protein